MFQCIIEQDELEFLWTLWVLVVIVHLFFTSSLQKLDVSTGFIVLRGSLHNHTFFINIRLKEVCEQKFFIFAKFLINFVLHTEALNWNFMNSIQNCVFIFIVDQLITEDSFALMSPKTNHIKFRFETLDIFTSHNCFILDLKNTFESSSQLTHVKQIVEFGWGRKHIFLDELP